MEFLNNYLNNIKETPEEYYHNFNQAVVISKWEDTTQIRQVKEQIVNSNPFEWTKEYREYDAWVDTVSDMLVNANKVYSDFIEILPQDINHVQNYRGQYYKVACDKENEETYLCYDAISKLEQTPNFKCVRCNNVLTFVNKNNKIVQYPCYLGTDISSTNDYVAKSGIIPNTRMIVMVQVNDDTKQLVNNIRLMFDHSSTFVVEEINNFMHEEGTNGITTFMKIYVKYNTLLTRDNTELNLCDYYNADEYPSEETITKKTLVVDCANATIKQGKSLTINYKVVDENGDIVDQEIDYNCDWNDDNYYTIDKNNNSITVKNIKMAENPLNIMFTSDGCGDIKTTIWLAYKI